MYILFDHIKEFNKALPVRSLHAIKDGGLHLNEAGQCELRRCFQHAINHM